MKTLKRVSFQAGRWIGRNGAGYGMQVERR